MKVKATSFADPKDVAKFRACKKQGRSDEECFAVGDNGVGYWGDDVSEGTGPACALPPDDVIAKWGQATVTKQDPRGINNGKYKSVKLTRGDKSGIAIIKDTMPWRRHIKNGAGIDLNPDACKLLGLKPPVGTIIDWEWA